MGRPQELKTALVVLCAAVGLIAASEFAWFPAADVVRSRLRAAHPRLPDWPVLDDPVAPGRLMRVEARAAGGIRSVARDDAWVQARPNPKWQRDRPVIERGGIDPCNTPDPGRVGFSGWHSFGAGRYLLPTSDVFDADGRFDVLMHFHGHDLALKEFVRAEQPIVLFAMSSAGGYTSRFAGPEAFNQLLAALEQTLAKRRGAPAQARKIALSAWSAGYEAVGALLPTAAERIDAVVLLDGLHASRVPAKADLQLAPFIDFARRATRGERWMLVTHASIDPGRYASSAETAHRLVHAVGGAPLEVRREDPLGMQLVEAFSERGFHVRGYAGGGERDHCAHLSLLTDAVRALAARWQRSSMRRGALVTKSSSAACFREGACPP